MDGVSFEENDCILHYGPWIVIKILLLPSTYKPKMVTNNFGKRNYMQLVGSFACAQGAKHIEFKHAHAWSNKSTP
jgi:hypothetical protein